MTILTIASAWALGIWLGARYDASGSALGLLALGTVLLAILLRGSGRTALPAVALAAVVLGLVRSDVAGDASSDGLAPFQQAREISLRGTVAGYPEESGTVTRVVLSADAVNDGSGWAEAEGGVLVTLRRFSELAAIRESPLVRYRDRLVLRGRLEAPPVLDDFDYAAYLARQGIGAVMLFPDVELVGEGGGSVLYRWLDSARRRLADSLATSVAEPQAAFGQALLLGIREDLPDELVDRFRDTGTSHLLAISGLHVGVVLGISLMASAWALGRRRQLYLVVPLAVIWVYALLAGLPPSAARAALMGTVFLAAHAVGRPRSALPALGLAAAIMVGLDPDVLWSVSFQLSFAAMAGIATLAPPMAARVDYLGEKAAAFFPAPLTRQSWAANSLRAVYFATIIGVAATAATLPLVAFHFQRISLVGIPATLLAMPALPAVLVAHAATAAVGLVSGMAAAPLGWVAWLLGTYVTGLVTVFSRLPGIAIDTGQLGPWLVWAYYGGLGLTAGESRPRRGAYQSGYRSYEE